MFAYEVAFAETHMTGSLVEQPVGTELASRIRGVAPARRRPEALTVPAVGWLVTMNALQVGGLSVVVSVVSNQTCATRRRCQARLSMIGSKMPDIEDVQKLDIGHRRNMCLLRLVTSSALCENAFPSP